MKWMTTVQTDVILCNYREGYVTKTHTHQPISNPADISDCNYGSGYCFHPKQGIAVTYYVPDPMVQSKFVQVGT